MSKKPATQGKPQPAAGPAAADKLKMTVRHYCQGIGDCHLLSIPKPNGSVFRMLIDCGVHVSVKGGAALVADIVADIKTETDGKIDVLVVTHEHWDHVSGFLTSDDLFKDGFTVGEVWMAWTENAEDQGAAELDKFKTKALSALQGASQKLEAERTLTLYMASMHDGLQAVLGFQFGAAGERVRAARDAAARLSKKPPIYFEPGGPLPSVRALPNLRIYVLGPPRDKAALQLEEKASEMYPLATGGAFARALSGGLALDEAGDGTCVDELSPFESSVGTQLSAALNGSAGDAARGGIEFFVRRYYSGPVFGPSSKEDPDQSWRRIDADWMGIAADLALQLDRGVNNTSLVLAFEFGDRVFLFPGDAQIGNWLSWKDLKWPVGEATVTAADLMARTVYLKVAHHGSQNATPQKQGLDLLTNPHLSAFIPTNRDDAKNVHWGAMPYDAILTALAAKTNGRVIRADDKWLADEDGKPAFATPSGSIMAVRHKPRDDARGPGGLWVEVDLA